MDDVSLMATGERTAPGLPDEEYWFARHEAAYLALPRLLGPDICAGLLVDAGAGEGYGAQALLTAGAGAVTALEFDATACRHAAATYPGVDIVQANLDALPLRSGAADAVISCQVIEHLWDLPRFLRECRRVLRPGGAIVVTTPNRLTFSPGLARGERPVNPFHVEEFDAAQVVDMLVEAGFVDVGALGLRHSPRLVDWERAHGSIVAAQVDAVLSGHWPDGLRAMVSTVTHHDFAIDVPSRGDDADIIGIGWAQP